MIDRSHDLPLRRQAELLRLSRGGLYYQPRAVPAADLAIIRRIDELHLDYPFAGSRMLRDLLRGEGIAVGRDRVASMMRRMGIEALYRRPPTSKPADGHTIYQYLLRGLTVDRANQVWAMDITYNLMARGFVYLGRGGLVQSAGARPAPGATAVFLQAADRSVGANFVRAAFDGQAFRAFFCGEG